MIRIRQSGARQARIQEEREAGTMADRFPEVEKIIVTMTHWQPDIKSIVRSLSPSSSSSSFRRYLITIAVFIVGGVLAFMALIIPYTKTLSEAPMQAGLVAAEDVLAPKDLTYPSDLLTEELRQKVVAEIAPMYTPTDTSVARQQLEHLRTALAYITSVRADQYASTDQKLADLSALEEITLDPETALSILDLSDSRWQAVQQEAIIVLEQIMRTTIREDRLEDARISIPAFISLSLSDDQANIVYELVSAFFQDH